MEDRATAPRLTRLDAMVLALLLAMAVGIHGWVIAHTEVAARDSIGFIRYALALQQHPWLEVLPHAEQHPVYPLAVLAVSLPVRHFLGTTCESMTFSAQATSALAGTLLVIPMFLLGREWFDRRVGFWAALLFQVLPAAARVTSDALSDGVFYLLAMTALLQAGRALRKGSPVEFALCGLSAGLAYLTRPEGALIVLTVLVAWLGMQALSASRWPWRRVAAGGLALSLAFGTVAGPYMAVIGGFSLKPTPRKFLQLSDETDTLPPVSGQGQLTAGPLLAIWWDGGANHTAHPPFYWGVWALGREVVRASQSVFWLPTLLGLWWFRGLVRVNPGMIVVLVLACVYALIVARMAVVVGYLSERHTLFLVLCGLFWAAAAQVRLADWLANRTRPVLAVAVLAALAASLASESLRPLHANRAGHRAAGLWLREHFHPGDTVLDPFCWAHYYAGAVFAEGTIPPPGFVPALYVVLENSTNQHSRLPLLTIAREVAKRGVPVYRWTPQPSQRKNKAEEVIIYAIPSPAGRGK